MNFYEIGFVSVSEGFYSAVKTKAKTFKYRTNLFQTFWKKLRLIRCFTHFRVISANYLAILKEPQYVTIYVVLH